MNSSNKKEDRRCSYCIEQGYDSCTVCEDAVEGSSLPEVLNQCWGCQKGLPLDKSGLHMYSNHIHLRCTKDRYEGKERIYCRLCTPCEFSVDSSKCICTCHTLLPEIDCTCGVQNTKASLHAPSCARTKRECGCKNNQVCVKCVCQKCKTKNLGTGLCDCIQKKKCSHPLCERQDFPHTHDMPTAPQEHKCECEAKIDPDKILHLPTCPQSMVVPHTSGEENQL